MDQNKIDLCNTSVSIMDKLQNIYPNNKITANEIYNIYNMSLSNLKQSSKNNKLEDITKKAQFYFNLYNIINKKKCQNIEKNEYKCSFVSTNLPNQNSSKKIQININNNLFNGAILNNAFYSFKNKNGFVNNNLNNNISGVFDQNNDTNTINIIDDDKENENTKSKKMANKENKNELIGKKRNLDDKAVNDEQNNKKKKVENNNKNGKNGNKNQKRVSPMLEINKNVLKPSQKQNKNVNKNDRNKKFKNKNNNRKMREQPESTFSWVKVSEEEEEKKFMNFEKDLKDYLRRTISNKRQKIFFNNILPESLEIMQKLFVRDNNVSTNIDFPIYRNEYLEVTLAIQQGGKIKKKITYLKS